MGTVPTTVHPESNTQEGKTMKALAWFGAKDVRIIDAPVPDITEPDDVILKVTGTTICGSDLHLYHGEILALQKGDILGHEVSVVLLVHLVWWKTDTRLESVYGHRGQARTKCDQPEKGRSRRSFFPNCMW